MQSYVALLRAVNVMGTGKLPMTELKAMCEALGFKSARTYIASGNVVFRSSKAESQVKAMLEKALAGFTGRRVGVLVRSAAEMAAVLAANPYAAMPGNRTVAFFLEEAPNANALQAVSGQVNERCCLGIREIYVYYPDGIAGSRIKIPGAKTGTARNMNTIAKLAELARDL